MAEVSVHLAHSPWRTMVLRHAVRNTDRDGGDAGGLRATSGQGHHTTLGLSLRRSPGALGSKGRNSHCDTPAPSLPSLAAA